MLSIILIVVGGILMGFGVLMLSAWVSGKSTWFDAGVYDRRGTTMNERQFLNLYFVSMVLAPLLGGAILIVFGLRRLL